MRGSDKVSVEEQDDQEYPPEALICTVCKRSLSSHLGVSEHLLRENDMTLHWVCGNSQSGPPFPFGSPHTARTRNNTQEIQQVALIRHWAAQLLRSRTALLCSAPIGALKTTELCQNYKQKWDPMLQPMTCKFACQSKYFTPKLLCVEVLSPHFCVCVVKLV